MVAFPNCKINLGLNIIGKRSDGYHELETVFYPVQLRDAIEVIEAEKPRFSTSGLLTDSEEENNLCYKAYQLLKNDFSRLPQIQMHLLKAIPIGAGLGGGSADGAFTLKLLNKKFALGLSEKQLMHYAFQLGSDCPFFIVNKPCHATGRGEILEEINLDLSNYKIVLVYPNIHISTASAFSNILPCRSKLSVKELIQQPPHNWKLSLKNDFEEPVFKKHPEIKKIKEQLYNAGAIYASMSGSGSGVYAIFETENKFSLSLPKEYYIKEFNA